MKIYIIRHGETDANKDYILQGAIDWPLNEEGIKLARITGENLKDIKFDICFSSPQIRALNTAKLVLENSNNSNTKIITDNRIREYELGDWEGKSYLPSKKEVNLFKVILFKKNPFIMPPPNGEKASEVIERTSEFLNELALKDYNNVLVSTHGGSTRAMLNMFYNNKKDFWHKNPPVNCAVNIVEVNNGKMSLIEEDKIYYDKSYLTDRYNIRKLLKK